MNQLVRRVREALLAMLFFGVFTGCNMGSSAPNPSTEVATEASALYIDTDALWDDAEIPVCWENDDSSNLAGRQSVREQVENTWEFVANVEFTGWGHCDGSWFTTPGISIAIEDVQPHTNWLGESLWGTGIEVNRARLTLNFTYKHWSTDCGETRDYCTRAIATHEFGHLLGFAHEQNREDTPDSCMEEAQGSDGDEVYGNWDRDSVMNYCNPVWNNGGNLSSTDIAGAQAYYGMGQRYAAAIFVVTSLT